MKIDTWPTSISGCLCLLFFSRFGAFLDWYVSISLWMVIAERVLQAEKIKIKKAFGHHNIYFYDDPFTFSLFLYSLFLPWYIHFITDDAESQ